MFYQFGLPIRVRRFTHPFLLPQFRTFHQVLPKQGPTLRVPHPRTGSGLITDWVNPARAILLKGVVLTGCVGLGLAMSLNPSPIHCDAYRVGAETSSKPIQKLAGAPQSEVNYYELSFGTIAGVCAGIFVKKGAKLVATLLGGIFVLLQYFHSMSFIHIDWTKVGKGIDKAIRIEDEDGTWHSPTVLSVWNWFLDFLTADFQPRASFIAGFLLGVRLG